MRRLVVHRQARPIAGAQVGKDALADLHVVRAGLTAASEEAVARVRGGEVLEGVVREVEIVEGELADALVVRRARQDAGELVRRVQLACVFSSA